MKTSPVSGLGAWLIQRVTAVYLLVFFLCLLVYFALFQPTSYIAWREATSGAGIVVSTSVFFVALLVHAWIGLRDVIMDYVKPAALRVIVLSSLAVGLIFMAAWSLHVLFAAGT